MRSVPLWKIILVVLVIIWGIWEVYPSWQWYRLPEQQQNQFTSDEIIELQREIDRLTQERQEAESEEVRNELSADITEKSRQISDLKDRLEALQQKAIPLGLDLKGGVHVVLKVDVEGKDPNLIRLEKELKEKREELRQTTEDEEKERISQEIQELENNIENLRQQSRYYLIDQVIIRLRNRIDSLGVREPLIQRQGTDRILVQIPAITDPADVLKVVGETAQLEFRFANTETGDFMQVYDVIQTIDENLPEAILAEKVHLEASGIPWIYKEDFPYFQEYLFKKDAEGRYTRELKDEVKALCPYGYSVMFGNPEPLQITENTTIEKRNLYLISDKIELTGEYLVDAGVQIDTAGTAQYQVNLRFDTKGAGIFSRVTGNNVGEHLAIVLDGTVYSAPVIQNKITGGNAQITGDFDLDEAKLLAVVLRSGALPASVSIEENRIISPTMGADSVQSGVRAGIVGVIVVVLFMIIYYSLSGVIAVIALILNVLLLGAALAFIPATLTLPGIAGAILIVGMAVDANVLIFERLREEMGGRAGQALQLVVDRGFGRAFWTIFDANFTTFIVALVLFQFGTGPVKGFAVTLSLGIMISMFTAVFVGRMFFDFLTAPGGVKTLHVGVLRPLSNTNVDFLKWRKIAVVFSICIIVIGMVYMVMNLNQVLGVDLSGGSSLTFRFEKPADETAVRGALDERGFPGVTVYRFTNQPREMVIRTKSIEIPEGHASVGAYVESVLQEELPDNPVELLKDDSVGPTVGNELISQAIWALIYSAIFIVIYIAIRFQLAYSVAAVTALLHDVLFTLGVFCLFNVFSPREINLPIIAALLTIVGYSLNDTIVVFDRIRENRRPGRGTFDVVVNSSINQTLSRTLITSLTTLVVVLSLFLFGGIGINDFAFTLLIGIIVGTYSSIFIASPVLLWWHHYSQKKASKARW